VATARHEPSGRFASVVRNVIKLIAAFFELITNLLIYYTSGAATQYAAYVENQWLTDGEAATGRGTQRPLFVSRTIDACGKEDGQIKDGRYNIELFICKIIHNTNIAMR